MEMEDKLKEAFTRVLALPPDANFDEVQYGVADNWDSIAHMQLVAEIEGAFDIMLTGDQVIDLSSFDKAREIVASHGVAFAA